MPPARPESYAARGDCSRRVQHPARAWAEARGAGLPRWRVAHVGGPGEGGAGNAGKDPLPRCFGAAARQWRAGGVGAADPETALRQAFQLLHFARQ